MEKEEAILELAALGFSKAEIDEFVRVEKRRRQAEANVRKREAALCIVRRMSL